MRTSAHIQNLWDRGGPFTGPDGKPNTIVTVQLDWPSNAPGIGDPEHIIHPDTAHVGTSADRGLPARWYQKADLSQAEALLPNVKSVNIDRSVDSDSATCNITLYNQWMWNNGAAPRGHSEIGRHGYFTDRHGSSMEAHSRWGQEANEWEGVLTPNRMLRTYQGYGGHDKTLAQAIADGNVVITGVWLIDDVSSGTDGMMNIRCRDMAKLLIEQQLYTPLVPRDKYPLTYYRYIIDPVKVNSRVDEVTTQGKYGDAKPGKKRASFAGSSVDAWYPAGTPYGHVASGGYSLHGHKGTDALDGNDATYWLSVGNSHPSKIFCTDWWQVNCGEAVNAVYLHPWGGNYEMYVSVMENGQWVGATSVPYDHTPLVGTQPRAVDTGADIPYVAKFTTPWETGQEYLLPRMYQAEKIRVTFRNHTYSPWGPWRYRVGIREFEARVSNKGSLEGATATRRHVPRYWHLEGFVDPGDLNAEGYLAIADSNHHDAFGDARVKPNNRAGDAVPGEAVQRYAYTPDRGGYWVIHEDGAIVTYGNAPFFGSPKTTDRVNPKGVIAGVRRNGWAGIHSTPSGNGYWAVRMDGTIYAYGDAPPYAAVTGDMASQDGAGQLVVRSAVWPNGNGLALVSTSGSVYVVGDAVDYGDWTGVAQSWEPNGTTFHIAAIDYNLDGTGYWLTSTSGQVIGRGTGVQSHNATPLLTERDYELQITDMEPTPSQAGYWMIRANGDILAFGDATHYGSPKPGSTGSQRSPGNYCVDHTTEALTKRGWLTYDQIQIGDDVWSLNPDTGRAEWSAVERMFVRDVKDEPMIRFESQNFSALTTRDHRWYVDHGRYGWQWRTSDCVDMQSRVPLCAPPVLPDEKKYDDDWVELVAWFWTEGSFGTHDKSDYRASLSQSEQVNPHYVARIDALLHRLYGSPGLLRSGAFWHRKLRKDRGVVIYRLASRVRDELLDAMNNLKAVNPDFLANLTATQLETFIEVSWMADGHVRNTSRTLGQKEKKRSDQFQMALALSGRASTLRQYSDFWVASNPLRTHAYPMHGRIEDRPAELYTGTIWCPTTGNGTWMARRDGVAYFTGNSDWSDIVKDLIRWSGFHLYDESAAANQPGPLWAAIESTGSFSPEPLPDEMFDKRPVIDAITDIKEAVGYICYVDEEGRFNFTSPNWWSPGNFDENGAHIGYTPEVDERAQLTQYTASQTDESLRSELIISSEDPDEDFEGTITTRYIPDSARGLKGMIVPAMWVNGYFSSREDQRIMAELIALHIWFSQRTSSATAVANPCIGIDDQVRILERNSGDTYIHYVRGVSTSHDLDTGEYMMTLTTHWLGDADGWAISFPDENTNTNDGVAVTAELYGYLSRAEARSGPQVKGAGNGQATIITSGSYDGGDEGAAE